MRTIPPAIDARNAPVQGFAFALRLCAAVLIAAFVAGCSTLPPGADFPKSYSTALQQPELTRLGRQFADAAQAHPGTSAFRMLAVGFDGFLARIQMIDAAERTLDLQYFIFRADETGKLLADAVLRAADRGVRVRLMLDDGEALPGDEWMAALDAHKHIEVRFYNPFSYRGPSRVKRAIEFAFNSSRLDYRMHNKLMVVDNAIALVGGRNVGNQYFQIDPDGQYADDDVFAAGPVVQQLSRTFDEFWNSELSIPARALSPKLSTEAALEKYRAHLKENREQVKADGSDWASRIATGQPLAGMLAGRIPLVWASSELVYDSPDKKRVVKGEMVGRLMHKPVANAVANVKSELLMITPYLIPGEDGMRIFDELRKRNVTVRILTSSLEASTVVLAHSGYMRYREPLLEMGVGLYEVRSLLGNTRGSGQSEHVSRFGTYSLHAKLFVLDRERIFVGSMNFDLRSMHLNTEIGLIIDSPELARQAATRFEAMVEPANAYAVELRRKGNSNALVWRTLEDGRLVEYDREPARSGGQRVQVKLLSLLNLDEEL